MLLGNGDGTFQPQLTFSAMTFQPQSTFGAATFEPQSTFGAATGRGFTLADWNGDGRLDLIALSDSGKVLVRSATVMERFRAKLTQERRWRICRCAAVADLNSDGSLDIIAAGDELKLTTR